MQDPKFFQEKLEAAVSSFVTANQAKPSLLQINDEDFRSILPYKDESSKYGLRIRGVVTIGTKEINPGQFFIIP